MPILVVLDDGETYSGIDGVSIIGVTDADMERLANGDPVEDISATFTIDLPAGRYEGEWIDTKTGQATELALEHEGGHRQLATPPFDNDIAFRIKRIP